MFGPRTLLILVVFVAGLALAAFGFRRAHTAPDAPAASPAALASEDDDTPRADQTVDSRRQQLIGVRTVTVHRATMAPEIRAAGTITYDETRQAQITTRLDGWIRDLRADYTGRPIRRGEALFTLYSPDLAATQSEYLLALRGRSTMTHDDDTMRGYAERLAEAARERLLRLDMTPEDVDALQASGRASDMLTFRSPVSGIIVEKAAVQGMRVTAGQMLYRVADLSTVWVEAEVAPTDLASVHVGMPATVSVDAYPGRSFTGRVAYMFPAVSEQTRTARVRLTLPNASGLLKPNMLATVSLETTASDALVVPDDAVVDTGVRHLVFVAEGDGRFSPREVGLGRRAPGQVEVASGLRDGDTVAASATFFLDSESQLRGALQNYEPAQPSATASADARRDLRITFHTDPDPPRIGEATFIATVFERGTPVTDATVKVVLSMPAMPAMNMPAMRSEASLVPVGNGTYRGTGQIMTPGRWDVVVTITRDGQPLGTGHFSLIPQ